MHICVQEDSLINNDIVDFIEKRFLKACVKDEIDIANDILYNYHININRVFDHINVDFIDEEFSNKYYEEETYNPLIIAICNGNIDISKILIDHDRCNLKILDNHNSSALYYACVNGLIDIVKLLLAYNIEINQLNLHGTTPLMAACEYNYIGVVKELLDDPGIDLFVRNQDHYGGDMTIDFCKNNQIKILLKEYIMEHFDFLPVPDDVLQHIMTFY